MEQSMILFGQEITGTNDFKVVKVPEVVYQIFYDYAQQRHNALWQRQEKIYKELCVWVDEAHPGWGIQNFIDLSNDDVSKINAKHINNALTGPLELMNKPQVLLSWGMYVLLQRGVPHIQRRTEYKQIEDNNPTINLIGEDG